ncbi:MAG: CHAT domain-containing protein, partial [Bacteroidota bacterium]
MQLILLENKSKIQAGIPDSLLAKEINLKKTWGDAQRAWMQYISDGTLTQAISDSLENLMFEQKQALDKHVRQLESTYPQYASLKYSPPQEDFASLLAQSQSSGESYWVSFWGEEAIYIFQIYGGGVVWYKQTLAEIIPWVQTIRQELEDFPAEPMIPKDFQTISHQLYQALKLDKMPTQGNWIIIPDGPLHLIPFEVLCWADRPQETWRELSFVGLKQAIRYQYILQAFTGQDRDRSWKETWLGMAPVYSGLAKMRFNQEEVLALDQMFPSGMAAVGAPATKQQFLAKAPAYEVLHFAGHARASTRFPLRSYLEFSPSSSYKLYAWEIYNLSLPARLAVLSGCETGFGKLQKGEGVMGLARAFRYAGVENVVQSLWVADGQSTQILMQSFYQTLN